MNNANGGSITFHFKGDDSDLKNTKNGIEGLTKSMVISTGVTKVLSAGFNMISNSMDDAISRYDTMNNFPRVMENLGIATEDSQKSIDKMSESLMGLPTTLDQGAMAVQRFTSANGDIDKSTDLFLAVNNAILAGGASSEIQASALEQLSQAYAKGKPDMMEWRTLMTAMPAQLKQVANAMGYVDASALGEDLREGTITMDDFTNTIMQLNKEGVNGFASFETQARASTGGISTAMKNLKSRVATGVTEMISAVNKGLEENGFGGIAQVLSNLGTTIKDTLTSLAPYITAIVSTAIQWLPSIINFLKAILPILTPIFLAVKSYQAVVTAVKVATMLWNGAQMILNGTMALNPVGLVIAGIVALIATIVLLWNKCEWFRDGVKAVISHIVAFISELILVGKKVLKYFGDFLGNFADIGMNVVRGIANGISNGYNFIKNTIKKFVGNVTDFIKKMFKIGSPSRLMENSVGQWIPKGIAVGIDANTDAVTDSMEKLQESTLGVFSNPSLEHSLHYSPNVIVNNHVTSNTDPLGQTVTQIKTFANGAKNDYNYGMGW